MILRRLQMSDREHALQPQREMASDGFDFLLDSMGTYSEEESWEAYLARLSSIERGENVPFDWVPSTLLVAEVDSQIVGRVSIRHELKRIPRENVRTYWRRSSANRSGAGLCNDDISSISRQNPRTRSGESSGNLR